MSEVYNCTICRKYPCVCDVPNSAGRCITEYDLLTTAGMAESMNKLSKRIEKLEQREAKEPKDDDWFHKTVPEFKREEKKESELEEYLQRILCKADEQCVYNAKESSERIRELALKKVHYAINSHKFSGHDSVQTYIDLIKKALEGM